MAQVASWRAAAACALLPWLLQPAQAAIQYTASCNPYNTDDPLNPPWEKGCGCPLVTSTQTLSIGATGFTSIVTKSGTTEVVVGLPSPSPSTFTSTLSAGETGYTSTITQSSTTKVVVGTPKPFKTIARYVHGSITTTGSTTSNGTVFGMFTRLALKHLVSGQI
jgi:hypothetical protein